MSDQPGDHILDGKTWHVQFLWILARKYFYKAWHILISAHKVLTKIAMKTNKTVTVGNRCKIHITLKVRVEIPAGSCFKLNPQTSWGCILYSSSSGIRIVWESLLIHSAYFLLSNLSSEVWFLNLVSQPELPGSGVFCWGSSDSGGLNCFAG